MPVVSSNPQVSNQALLLVAELAAFAPNQVVSHVMPIFTFMGTNLLQRDDAYSSRVVEKVSVTEIQGLGTGLTTFIPARRSK
jgi:U3 small nucleolar RNA-associated protein 10